MKFIDKIVDATTRAAVVFEKHPRGAHLAYRLVCVLVAGVVVITVAGAVLAAW
jgi:hypothetical protein